MVLNPSRSRSPGSVPPGPSRQRRERGERAEPRARPGRPPRPAPFRRGAEPALPERGRPPPTWRAGEEVRGERAGDGAPLPAGRWGAGTDVRRMGGEAPAHFRQWEPLPVPVTRLCQDCSHRSCPQTPGGREGKGWGVLPASLRILPAAPGELWEEGGRCLG